VPISCVARGRKGFIAFYSFILLLILGIFGIGYWATSRMTTDMILKEAHRIRARNFAQAGIEKVLVNIMNQYRLGNHNLEYPGKMKMDRIDKEYNVEFGDGRYAVETVERHTPPGSDKMMYALPYFKNQVLTGYYDVWRVVVVGEVPDTHTKARVETLVKIIRNFVQY
jgi:hypothetical protein